MKFKLNVNNILETALGFGLVAGAGLLAFYIGQHYFSLFSYQGMSRPEVLQLYKSVEKRLPILSRACGKSMFGDDFCRGIYLTKEGNVLYYRFEDNQSKNHASYSLYSIPSEHWTTTPEIIPGLGGRVTEIH